MPPAVRAAALDGVAHGFLGRRGGISRGLVAGLNAGFGADDDAAAVAENRARAVAAVMPGAVLVAPYQVHSAKAVIVDQPWAVDARPRADAVVTDRPGLVLGIVTADCAPILLADRAAGVVGAAHAGWRGAHDGVIAATIEAMEKLGAQPARINAAIGPCIAQSSYEVDLGFRQNFTGSDEGRFFAVGKAGHFQFDLEAYVAERLKHSGIGVIERLGLDTYSDEASYYSYRRATHRAEPTYGRQISLIGISG